MIHKKPISLVNAEKPEEVIAYACGKCGEVCAGIGKGPGMFHAESGFDFAKRHCGPWICKTCGEEHDRKHQPTCRKCFDEAWAKKCAEKEAKRFEKAEKITEYDGLVYCEVASSGDGYFHSVQDLIDHCECEDIDVPSYAWACTAFKPQINVVDMFEQALDEHHEGCELDCTEELAKYVEQWNAKQTGTSWMTDYSRAVLIDESQ